MTIGIYRLCFNDTDSCYIGQSVNIEKRYKQHLQNLEKEIANKKLLDAYKKHGCPFVEVLIECSIEELDKLEEEAISIFNSVDMGFNIYKYSNEAPILKGTEAGNSKYTREQLIKVLDCLANSDTSIKDISKIAEVPAHTIYNIVNGTQHQWIVEEFSELWKKAHMNKLIRLELDNRKRAEYQKSNRSAKARGIAYPPILSPNNTLYTVECVQEFARVHGISKSSLHRILTRQVSSCKGWRLHEHV